MGNQALQSWLAELSDALQLAATQSDAPVLDIEWLLLRCRDTSSYSGELQMASVLQLIRELQSFSVEHPNRLAASLVDVDFSLRFK